MLILVGNKADYLKGNKRMKIYIVLQLIMLGLAIHLLCACVPVLTGLKQIKTNKDGSSEYNFITGLDVGASLNGVDTVNNNRGINPNGR